MNYYFDYSATTKADEDVLKIFNEIACKHYANPNSMHLMGKNANAQIENSINVICNYFDIKPDEIIFTSGASEANNTVIKGITSNDRNEIITTKLEHSSIYGPIGFMQKQGFNVKFVSLNEDGTINIDHLKKLVSEKTALVSIGMINSELGIRQPIEEIGKILKNYPNIYFHSDITQALGKIQFDLTNVDLASFSGHKIFCFKGIGGLIKKESIKLEPLIHGGKSTSVYRSGTPQTELICSLGKAIELLQKDFDEHYIYVKKINKKITNHLKKYKTIKINSPENSIPHILNISFLSVKSNEIQKYFENNNIYISTKTACASDNDYSKGVYEITKDMARATSCVRISLSYKTTEKEVDYLLSTIDKMMEHSDEIS